MIKKIKKILNGGQYTLDERGNDHRGGLLRERIYVSYIPIGIFTWL